MKIYAQASKQKGVQYFIKGGVTENFAKLPYSLVSKSDRLHIFKYICGKCGYFQGGRLIVFVISQTRF
jgi:hypothetical protein